jgi:NADH:ubiquinone oxidoreductase subunit 6 (subunit J)
MTFHEFLFWSVGLMTCLSAVMVAVTQNIVRAAVWLLFTLAGTAGLYFLLGADFLGATQLIIYVGGILILVVFGVMLTAQGPFVNLKTPAGEWVLSMIVGLVLLGLLGTTFFMTDWSKLSPATVPDAPRYSTSATDLGRAFLSAGPVQEKDRGDPLPELPGRTRTQVGYLFPFEIVSIHLLVVLIGAAYLARAKRRRRDLA